jgi:hypothetical protein
MNEPMRLRDGQGAARRLMAGSVLRVPSASRRRAVAFTSAAATMGASATAIAASATSVAKSFLLCVAIGAAGGGVMSLAASETIARFDTKAESHAQPGPQPPDAHAVARASSQAPAVVAVETPPEVPAPVLVVPVAAPDASGKGKSPARDEAVARGRDALEAPAKVRTQPSLFEEQRIIESARAAVARGDARTAFSLLDDYEHAYASKQFWPEALALRVEALRNNGQLAAARALAADFAQRYPHHPLLQRVQGAVAR